MEVVQDDQNAKQDLQEEEHQSYQLDARAEDAVVAVSSGTLQGSRPSERSWPAPKGRKT